MSQISKIYQDGNHYDRIFGPGNVDFWLEQAKRVDGPILELGCGTGKLSIPLAEAGFDVTGLDYSKSLLSFASKKNPDVSWNFADMRDFKLEKRFAMIMLPSNNLGHLHSVDDFRNCTRCVREHLLPSGRFIIDVFVPNLNLLIEKPDVEHILSEYDHPDGKGRVTVYARSEYEPSTQIRKTSTIAKLPGEPDQTGSLDLKMYFPRELEALLMYNGFNVIERFGGHSGEDFNDKSPFQILVCEKDS